MKKRFIITLSVLVLIVAVIASIKAMQIKAMVESGKKFVQPPQTVTTAVVKSEVWREELSAVGSLVPVQGVTVSAELSGKVVAIGFKSGNLVKKGELLVSQDTASEQAQLAGAKALAKSTKADLERAAKMLPDKIISQADYDKARATYDQAVSQARSIKAIIDKKTIRAPFSGRLGIRKVNLGQMLKEGDPIVSLESLDPIYVNFSLPQQQMIHLRRGLRVRVSCDAYPCEANAGKITAIEPRVESETRNIQVEAELPNKSETLHPGMFVRVAVELPGEEKSLVIPSTAVLYAPYGDSVFIVQEARGGKGKTLRQQFIRLGKKHGDFVTVTEGLKEGESVVSTGAFTLQNGQSAVVDNKLAPDFKSAPTPENN
ncbi:MAG: efflux RND transporter periplasmic adaptor subunit [Syntrophobacteraceae bacterium]